MTAQATSQAATGWPRRNHRRLASATPNGSSEAIATETTTTTVGSASGNVRVSENIISVLASNANATVKNRKMVWLSQVTMRGLCNKSALAALQGP